MNLEYIDTETKPLGSIIHGIVYKNSVLSKVHFYDAVFIQHINQYYGKKIKQYSDEYGITYGKEWGLAGVKLNQLLATTDTENRYEISALVINKIPLPKLRKLCANYKLLITDISETGITAAHFINNYPDLKFKDTVFLSAGVGELFPPHDTLTPVNLPEGTSIVNIPFCLYSAVSFYLHHYELPAHNSMENQLLIPCYKPRPHRIDVLNKFEKAGLLAQADWSLSLNTNKYTTITDPDSLGQSRVDFLNRHDLPRLLKQVDTAYDTICLNRPNYKWHVVTESYISRIEITEKIFQAFLLKNPPLIISGVGTLDALAEMGFKLEGDYEDADYLVQTDNIIDIIKSGNTHTKHLDHNQQRCLDLDYWSKYFVQKLKMALTRQPDH